MQIDYIITGTKDKWRLQTVDTKDKMYIGNDHRTVTATLKIKSTQSKSKKAAKHKEVRTNRKSWEPRCKDKYASALDEKVVAECKCRDWAGKSNSEKVDALEKILTHTAVQRTELKNNYKIINNVSDVNLRVAIEGRNHVSREQTI